MGFETLTHHDSFTVTFQSPQPKARTMSDEGEQPVEKRGVRFQRARFLRVSSTMKSCSTCFSTGCERWQEKRQGGQV
jgi:hypothetical protein